MHDKILPLVDAAPVLPPADWQASWIWSRAATDGVHSYVYFRACVQVDTRPATALLRYAAERDATIWLNGELIAQGPPISDPRAKRYESIEVASGLALGRNCIAARVYHDKGRGSFTAHADARGLLCQLEVDGAVVLASDESWRAEICPAYLKPTGLPFGDSLWPEHVDSRLDFPDWQAVSYDDARWALAQRVIPQKHGLWGAEQPQARFYPWVNLLPCETRPLRRVRHRPAAIHAVGEVRQRRETSRHDVAVRMSLESILPTEKTSVDHIESLLTGDGQARIHNSDPREPEESFDGLRQVTVVLDFGRLMNAHLIVDLDAAAAVLDVGYAFQLEDGRVVPYTSDRAAMADHYITRAGRQVWRTADWRHFRYVQITIRNTESPVTLAGIWAEEITNHADDRGQFSSSDAGLDRAFEIVRRTTRLNVVDRTMDNPSRERKQYLGDCSAIVPAITSCFGDSALLRRYFANAREGQHMTGQYRYSYPGHDDDRASLFDHALAVPLRIWEHYQVFGDHELVAEMWPGIERLMHLAESCVDAEGFMQLPPYNIWFDWGHMDRRGCFLPLQAMTAEAARRAAELAMAAGADGSRWQALAERLITQIPRWYDEERGAFVDAIVDGERQAHCSEHALSLIAHWDLAPAAMIQAALSRWAAEPGAYGTVSPAWAYLPGALIHAGRTDLATRWLHGRLAFIDRQGLDTWPETWCLYGEATLGTWRCRNSRAVAQGAGLGAAPALLQELCGIQAASPGMAVVHLRPQPGELTWIAGTLPGPDGDYTLRLERHADRWQLDLQLPSPREVILDAVFAPELRTATLNGQSLAAATTVLLPSGVTAGQFAWPADINSTLIFSR